jgi:hypothetical protein
MTFGRRERVNCPSTRTVAIDLLRAEWGFFIVFSILLGVHQHGTDVSGCTSYHPSLSFCDATWASCIGSVAFTAYPKSYYAGHVTVTSSRGSGAGNLIGDGMMTVNFPQRKSDPGL